VLVPDHFGTGAAGQRTAPESSSPDLGHCNATTGLVLITVTLDGLAAASQAKNAEFWSHLQQCSGLPWPGEGVKGGKSLIFEDSHAPFAVFHAHPAR
jgi:hypothetical protein